MLVLSLLALPCAALDLAGELGADAVTEALPSEAAEALDGLDLGTLDAQNGLERVVSFFADHFRDELSSALRPAASVLAIALLCGLLGSVPDKSELDYAQLGGCVAVSALSLANVRSAVSLASETLDTLSEYSRVLLPTLTTAALSAGALTSAGAKYAASALFSDVLLTGARELVLPAVCAVAATAAAGAALGTKQLQGAEKLLTWLGKSLLKYLTLAFTLWLSLTGVLSGSADAAAVKAARAAISTALPVVGRALSDASASLVAGVGMVRNAIGVFGMLAVLASVALPLLRLGLRCLLFRAAAALGGMLAGERMTRLLNSIGTVYAMLMGLVGTGAALLLLSVISLLRTVTA